MAGPSNASSVRNLYTPPQEEWLFLPPTPGQSSTTNATPSSTYTSPSNLGASNPTITSTVAGLELDADDEPFSLYGLGTMFASEYLTTALGMPFEVGKTLLQVEYKPKPGVDDGIELEGIDYEVELDSDSASDEDRPRRPSRIREDTINSAEDAEVYFQDTISSSRRPIRSFQEDNGEAVDSEGYLPDLPPNYLLRVDMSPSGSAGVWGMMRRIRRTPSEGLPGLWKGQLLTTLHSLLSNNLQPLVHSCLLFSLPPPSSAAQIDLNANLDLPLSSYHNPVVPLGLHVTAHLLTHMFLSPLELLRTRLIAQPASDNSSKSSFGLLKSAISEEGGIFNLYTHSQLLIPALLEHTLRPIFTLSIPLFIERKLGFSPETAPITYSMLDLSLGLASLLIILPIETARKRLQLQDRTSQEAIWQKGDRRETRKSVVRLRKRPYYGLVDTIWRIISEETGVPKKKRSRRRGSRSDQTAQAVDEYQKQRAMFDGLKQLYRGFGMAAGAHFTVFALGLVSAGLGGRSLEYGWKEI